MKLICPVCKRTAISDNICPNCETDLSSIRLLLELKPLRFQWQWLLALGCAALIGIVGWVQ